MAVGHCYGKHTDETGTTTLPDHFKCPENTIASLISAIYPGINELSHPSDDYFASRTIPTSRNADVDDINEKMLSDFPGEEKELFLKIHLYMKLVNCMGF